MSWKGNNIGRRRNFFAGEHNFSGLQKRWFGMVTLLLQYTSKLAQKISVPAQNSHLVVIYPSSEMGTGHFKVAKKERGQLPAMPLGKALFIIS